MSDVDTLHEAETTARGIEAYRLAIKNEGHIFNVSLVFFMLYLYILSYTFFLLRMQILCSANLCADFTETSALLLRAAVDSYEIYLRQHNGLSVSINCPRYIEEA